MNAVVASPSELWNSTGRIERLEQLITHFVFCSESASQLGRPHGDLDRLALHLDLLLADRRGRRDSHRLCRLVRLGAVGDRESQLDLVLIRIDLGGRGGHAP